MHPNTRACLAYIASKLVNESTSAFVYDYSQFKRLNISGSVDPTNVSLYDHERCCHITGPLSNLYDHDQKGYVSLSISGCRLSGYDFAGSHQFCGSVDGYSVTILEIGTSNRFCYQCSS
ncbi:MAG: hypothetical protein G3I10_02765 [Ferrovum sp.]|nr:hypothetical protein [Ferrovum sp.]